MQQSIINKVCNQEILRSSYMNYKIIPGGTEKACRYGAESHGLVVAWQC